MPGFFDLHSFFRRVSRPLLERYFADTSAFADFDWGSTTPRKIDGIVDCFNASTPEQRQAAFHMFRRAEALADATGTQVLIEASRGKDSGVAAKLAAMKSAVDRSLWMCLEHPDLIEGARTLSRIESLSKRMWEPRSGLPIQPLEVTAEMKERLRRQIMAMFQPEQWRADHCIVEHVRREGGVECFFAYPADYLDEREGYDLEGKFERTSWNPAFKIFFAYHSTEGTLDVYAPGGSKIRERLAHIFAQAVLGTDQGMQLPELDRFDLEILKNPNLTFPTNPVDRIPLVRIQSMRLRFHDDEPATFDISLGGRRRDGRIHDVIVDKMREIHAHLSAATVVSAVLQAFVLTATGKERSLTFRLSEPSFCDLEDSPEEQALRRYLHIWGIQKDAHGLAEAA